MALSTAKTIQVIYDEVCEQLNKNTFVSGMVDVDSIDMGEQQNANDIYHKQVAQQSPVIRGRDLTGLETDVLQLGYPLQIDEPSGDFFTLNTKDLRDDSFRKNRITSAVHKMNSDLESRIMTAATDKGAIYYETASPDFDLVAEADTLFFERQLYDGQGRTFLIDPRANQAASGNLASRTLFPNNRSEKAYGNAEIGNQVAGFDMYRNQYAGTIIGNTNSTTTTADLELKPEASGTTAEGTPYNIDYRVGLIPVTASAGFNVGDVVTMGTNAVTMNDKKDTGQLMTFRVVGKPDGTSISVYPKPISWDQRPVADGGSGVLTAAEAAYANIATTVATGATVITVNTTAGSGRLSTFFANDAITVVNGSEPIEMLEDGGLRVEKTTLDNGIDLYLAYDSNLPTLNCRVRLFTRYGVEVVDPSRVGNVRFTG